MSQPRPTTSLFERFTASSGDDSVNVLEVLKFLLDWCADEREAFYRQMSDFEARRFKSRVRGFARRYLEATRDVRLPVNVLKPLDCLLCAPFEGACGLLMGEYLKRVWNALGDPGLQINGTSLELRRAALRVGNGFPLDAPLPATRVVIARALAQAIDDACVADFIPAYRELFGVFPPRKLAAGDLVPSRISQSWYPKPAYRFDRVDDNPCHLRNIRRLDSTTGIQLILDANWTDATEQLRDFVDPTFSGGIPAKLPARTLGFLCLGPCDDFHVTHDVDDKITQPHFYVDREPHPEDTLSSDGAAIGIKSFRGVYWKHEKQPEFIARVLAAANKQRVHLLMMPELTLTVESERVVREHLAAVASDSDPFPSLILAGSRHVQVAGDSGYKWRNRLAGLAAIEDPSLLDASTVSFLHDKVGTFIYSTNGYNVVEAIERPRELRVVLCNGVLTCFLICKDILQGSIIDAIQAAGVRRLFVVAMSPKVDEFAYHLAELATRNETISWLACATASGQITAGFFGPGRSQTSILLRNSFANPKKTTSTDTEPPPDTNCRENRDGSNCPSRPTSSDFVPFFPALSQENPQTVNEPSLWTLSLPFPEPEPKPRAVERPSGRASADSVPAGSVPGKQKSWFKQVDI